MILLINPPLLNRDWHKKNEDITPPMGLILLGSVLAAAGKDVRILDANLRPGYMEEIRQAVRGADLVGLSVMTTQIPAALEIAALVRREAPGALIVWGGIQPTLFPEQTAASPMADVAAIGEGDQTILELAAAVEASPRLPLDNISGIVFKRGDAVIKTAPRESVTDLDLLPEPRLDLIEFEKYVSCDLVPGRMFYVHTGFGCPHRCSFCIARILYHGRFRNKSAARIHREIDVLVREKNISHVWIQDENFFANRKLVKEFVEEYERRGAKFTWQANVRVDYFHEKYLNAEFLRRLRAAGCISLWVGAESGNDRILAFLKKDITVAATLQAARLAADSGISMVFSFMQSLPGETKAETVATMRFMYKLSRISRSFRFIGPQLYRPYPGSELFAECCKRGLTCPDSLEAWGKYLEELQASFVNPKHLPWIPDPEFAAAVPFWSIVLLKDLRQVPPRRRPAYLALKGIARLRLALNFWALPLEYRLYDKLRKKLKLPVIS